MFYFQGVSVMCELGVDRADGVRVSMLVWICQSLNDGASISIPFLAWVKSPLLNLLFCRLWIKLYWKPTWIRMAKYLLRNLHGFSFSLALCLLFVLLLISCCSDSLFSFLRLCYFFHLQRVGCLLLCCCNCRCFMRECFLGLLSFFHAHNLQMIDNTDEIGEKMTISF